MLTARNKTQNTEPVSLPDDFAAFGFYDIPGILETMQPRAGDRIEIDGEPFRFVAVAMDGFGGGLWMARFRIGPEAYTEELMADTIRARNEHQR